MLSFFFHFDFAGNLFSSSASKSLYITNATVDRQCNQQDKSYKIWRANRTQEMFFHSFKLYPASLVLVSTAIVLLTCSSCWDFQRNPNIFIKLFATLDFPYSPHSPFCQIVPLTRKSVRTIRVQFLSFQFLLMKAAQSELKNFSTCVRLLRSQPFFSVR